MNERSENGRWLLVIVSSGASSTLRVYAWRTLRALGALYLQNSVCVLPALPTTERAVKRLRRRMGSDGGDARVIRVAITDEAEETALIESFSAERQDEYGEIRTRTSQFLEEIANERARGRATYMEVEESEVDLRRLERWLEQITARDYFHAVGRDQAEAALAACAETLATFEAEAFAHEHTSEAKPAEPGA